MQRPPVKIDFYEEEIDKNIWRNYIKIKLMIDLNAELDKPV